MPILVRSKTGNNNGTNWDYCIHIITNQCALFWNNTGSATVSATGGTGLNLFMGYYTITNNGNSNGINSTYNVTVTDANSCSKILTVLITQPSVDLTYNF
jgi:hypothetical protein